MVLLLHLTPLKNAAAVRRSGISARSHRSDGSVGVYCAAILPSYTLTHQWSRELLRNRSRAFAAVQVRIPDAEPVRVGRYSERPRELSAAEAVGWIQSLPDPRGQEVFVPRAVAAAEIHRIRTLDRPVGWRYLPDAHGTRPCSCPACLQLGSFKSADLRRRFPLDSPVRPREEVLAELRVAVDAEADAESVVRLLWELESRRKGDAHRLAFLVGHPAAEVREELAELLAGFRGPEAARLLAVLRADPVEAVRKAATPED